MKATDLITIEGKNVVLDVSLLVSDEVVYVNATRLAKQFGKDKYQLRDFFNSKGYLEYEAALTKIMKDDNFKVGENHHFKNLRYTKKGKYGGTYLHSDLAIYFIRWLSPEFAVKCDMYIKQKIQEIHNEKLIAKAKAEANQANQEWLSVRYSGKATRKHLTDAIKLFCEYASKQREAQKGKDYYDRCPYYIKLTQLVYKALGLKKPKSVINPREIFNGATVERIEYLEDMLANLINDAISQELEYHEAFKSIKEAIHYEASLMMEVA